MSRSVRRSVCAISLSFALLVPSSSCRRADPHAAEDHGHEHAHDAPATEHEEHAERTLASLGERYLVHLIHPAFVRGAQAGFLLHGTRRDEGGPIAQGDVALVARGPDGATLRFAAREERPGHWPGEAAFPAAGRWTLAVDVRSGAGAELVELGAIEVRPEAASPARVEAPEPPAGAIPFPFEQQWPLAMRFERVAKQPMTEWLTVPGRVEARPGGEAHVAAPIAGRIVAAESGALPRPGARIAAGDVLAFVEPYLGTSELVGLQALEYQQHQLRHELDLQQLEAERALGSARVRIAAGTREVERAERLVAGTLATQQELDAARAELDLARAEETAALSSLASVHRLRNEHAEDPTVAAPRLPVVAPIGGVLADLDAVLGESVDAGARIAVVLDLDVVWAVAEVPESALARLGAIRGARVRGAGGGASIDVATAPLFTSPRVDPASRAVDVAFAVPDPRGELRAGQLLSFDLALREHADALSVPESALAYRQGRPLVYALVDGETFVERHLTLGLRDHGRVQVLSGLAAGEAIVATHAGEVRLAALAGSARIVEHQH